jgi:hypothetical protein
MAIDRKFSKKAPSQNPVDFYKGVQQGGANGSPQKVPDQLKGGPMREKVFGTKAAAKQ